ncbi:MAG TPA: hypothetical protein ENG51_21220 [Deltaproteobacteria bacterium]|nr:hypothetical protein [Deltaproteobacteria bacterium]
MVIHTSRFGKIEVNPERILLFPRGIPGFEHVKRYLLIEYKEGKFNWLQAVDDPDLAFIVCDPLLFSVVYKVPEYVFKSLNLSDENELAILLIVRVERSSQKIIPHVQAPLVFNTRSREGMQWVMDKKEMESYVEIVEKLKAAG